MSEKYDDPQTLDVDVRFLLANERTLLAWVRTAIALEAGGIALTQLSKHDNTSIAGVVILLLGGVIAIFGYTRFRAADRAIRNHHLPRSGYGPLLQVLFVVALALGLAVVQAANIW